MTTTAPTGLDTPTEALGHLWRSMRTFVRVLANGRVLEEVLRQSRIDLTRADFYLLHSLADEEEGIRPGELAERLGLDAPTVTRRVQHLEARHLVRRRSDPADRRAQLVQVTPAGARMVERASAAYHRWLEGVVATWSEDDRLELAELLGRFADGLQAGIG